MHIDIMYACINYTRYACIYQISYACVYETKYVVDQIQLATSKETYRVAYNERRVVERYTYHGPYIACALHRIHRVRYAVYAMR